MSPDNITSRTPLPSGSWPRSIPLTGEGESHGPIGDGSISVRDIAVATSLAFSKPLFSVFEDAGTATITVVRDGFLNVPLTVQFSTSSDSASAASDYTTTSGVLSFAASETEKTFQVPIINDALPEGDEFVNLLLSEATGPAVLGPPAAAQLRIDASDRNDEVGPQVLLRAYRSEPGDRWRCGLLQ